jgi:hypothetical protein
MLATDTTIKLKLILYFHSGKQTTSLNDKCLKLITTSSRHGLSYTTFDISSLAIKPVMPKDHSAELPTHVASVTITNTGPVPGSETIQIYISAPNSTIAHARPLKELHGFEKVFLQSGATKSVEIEIDRYATSFWDESEAKWLSEKGTYEVLVGTSSRDIVLRGTLQLTESRQWSGLSRLENKTDMEKQSNKRMTENSRL